MSTTATMTDPGEFAHSAEGCIRAGELASHVFEHLIAMTEVARLDTTIAGLFLLSEVLAALEVYADLKPEDAIRQVHDMTRERVAALRQTSTATEAEPTAAASVPVDECPIPGRGGSLH
jgi:hypothetical protein